ncbi:MAG: ImmA/IrrE family metallo-endopeptidase [Prolixibacteraceae bacterium]|nr:ImmA/IrrE family metallo-endopeptidase [Prolixibacteraceae bacterium]
MNSIEPISFSGLLQRLDVLSLFRPLGDNFSGLSYKKGDDLFMLINSNQSLGRQNFTIAHELYHLFYDDTFEPHICKTGLFPKGKKNINERWADIFASYLILPEEGIIQLIPDEQTKKNSITLPTLLKIEQTYGTSRSALLTRLQILELIDKNYQEKYSTNVKRSALQYGFNTELYEPTQPHAILGAYGSLANKLYDNDKVSEGHFNELLKAIGVDPEVLGDYEEN